MSDDNIVSFQKEKYLRKGEHEEVKTERYEQFYKELEELILKYDQKDLFVMDIEIIRDVDEESDSLDYESLNIGRIEKVELEDGEIVWQAVL